MAVRSQLERRGTTLTIPSAMQGSGSSLSIDLITNRQLQIFNVEDTECNTEEDFAALPESPVGNIYLPLSETVTESASDASKLIATPCDSFLILIRTPGKGVPMTLSVHLTSTSNTCMGFCQLLSVYKTEKRFTDID